MTLPRLALLERLHLFQGWGYVRHGASYPDSAVPGVSPGRVAPLSGARTNCVTFAESLLIPPCMAYLGLEWNVPRHRRFMLSDEDMYGNVEVLLEAGIGRPVTAPGRWTLVQGWRTHPSLPGPRVVDGGHTFLTVDYDLRTDRVLLLEANDAPHFGLVGVGYRGLGPINRWSPMIPLTWYNSEHCPTWEQICALYPHRRMVRLPVGPAPLPTSGAIH